MEENLSRGRILLLEDEPIIGRVTSRALQAEGYQVDIAVTGLIAKEKIETGDYDLMIFDVRTPLMSGIQLYEYIERAFPRLTGKVIFTTGDTMSGPSKCFLERVNNVYLSKPYSPSQLREAVHQAQARVSAGVQ